MSTGNRPGGELAKRPLQFIWLVDCSGSMLPMGANHLLLLLRRRWSNQIKQTVADANNGCRETSVETAQVNSAATRSILHTYVPSSS